MKRPPLNAFDGVMPQHCHFEDRRDEVSTLSQVLDIVGKSEEAASRA